MNYPKKLQIAILAGLACASSLSAVVVSTDSAEPTDGVFVSYVPSTAVGNSTAYYRGEPAPNGNLYRNIGQSFRVDSSDFSMTSVTWKINMFSEDIYDVGFSIDIYQLDAVNVAPAGAPISSQTGVMPNSLTSGEYITFVLDSSVEMDLGETYLVMFAFTEPTTTTASASGALGLDRTEGNVGYHGRLWNYLYDADTDTGNYVADSKTLNFYVQGTSIPEASGSSMFAFIALAAAGVAYFKRRGHRAA